VRQCHDFPYLRELGVTAVELMPVFQYDPDEGNYWGYMPLARIFSIEDHIQVRDTFA
jgi:pullulanase/glycogen debranching enzyme